jgi:pimeloyl-ACP methyl ester carboxylesterase
VKYVSAARSSDLQIRDYSLMDLLAEHDYDVWAIDIHGYGRSDKPKDWIDARSFPQVRRIQSFPDPKRQGSPHLLQL